MMIWVAYLTLWILAFLSALALSIPGFLLQARGTILGRGFLVYPLLIAVVSIAITRQLIVSESAPGPTDLVIPGLCLAVNAIIAVAGTVARKHGRQRLPRSL